MREQVLFRLSYVAKKESQCGGKKEGRNDCTRICVFTAFFFVTVLHL
jgi:hypothetical protein